MSKVPQASSDTSEIKLRKKLAEFIIAFADTPKWGWDAKHFAGHVAEYIEHAWEADWRDWKAKDDQE